MPEGLPLGARRTSEPCQMQAELAAKFHWIQELPHKAHPRPCPRVKAGLLHLATAPAKGILCIWKPLKSLGNLWKYTVYIIETIDRSIKIPFLRISIQSLQALLQSKQLCIEELRHPGLSEFFGFSFWGAWNNKLHQSLIPVALWVFRESSSDWKVICSKCLASNDSEVSADLYKQLWGVNLLVTFNTFNLSGQNVCQKAYLWSHHAGGTAQHHCHLKWLKSIMRSDIFASFWKAV